MELIPSPSPMTTDMTAPATKQDIALLMDQIGQYYDKTERRIHTMSERLELHFDVAVENIRHDLQSANREEIENIKDRVTRLERKTGLLNAA
ncbi:hypothetical protein EXS70_00715 [Candidatus Peribacteria bacterium]|nr:hypothetical protein [Candidatus Peribacteria bacterium]